MFQERLLYLLDVKCNGKKIELSKATGIASSVITSYFTRGSAPSAIQLVKIADFFKCSVDYLLGREDDFGVIARNDSAVTFTKEQGELLAVFNLLPVDQQREVIGFAKALAY